MQLPQKSLQNYVIPIDEVSYLRKFRVLRAPLLKMAAKEEALE